MSKETKTEFSPADWSDADTAKAQTIWEEYQKEHNLSSRTGQIVGIDPVTGDVWFGEWFTDIVRERREKGLFSPLWFERVGFPAPLRKGGRR